MKLTFCNLLIPVLLLQLIIPGSTQCSLDSIVEKKIQEALQEFHPSVPTISCTSVTSSGRLASCPAGTVVTSCACGYGCGSWDIQGETTCHCQCQVMDWTTARCCRML